MYYIQARHLSMTLRQRAAEVAERPADVYVFSGETELEPGPHSSRGALQRRNSETRNRLPHFS